MPDPYAVLGIDRSAGKTEIKAAYRTLVKRWHPDRHGDNLAARERFLEISEAYAQLSRSSKPTRPALSSTPARQRPAAKKTARPNPVRSNPSDKQPSDDEMMERIFGVTPARTKVDDAPSLQPDIPPDVPEAVSPAPTTAREGSATPPRPHKVRQALSALFARGRLPRQPAVETAARENTNTPAIRTAIVPLEVILEGGSVEVAITPEDTLSVVVARGTADGTIIAATTQDDDEIRVVIRHAFSDSLWASGTDVHAVVGVGLETAVLGGSTTFETLDGTIRLTIPAWSSSDKVMKVAGRGLPRPDDRRGNLFIHLRLLLASEPDQKLVDLMSARRNGLFV